VGDREIRVFESGEEVSQAAAELFVSEANRCHLANGRFVVALSGGSTPLAMFRLLANEYRDSVPWKHVNIFWVDERFVPLDDPESNYGNAKHTLLDKVPIADETVYPVPVHLDTAGDAAFAYEMMIRAFFEGGFPTFDLMYLGMGDDGHTASLFPDSAGLDETAKLVIATESPSGPRERVTLTLPVINASARIAVVVKGTSKREKLRATLGTRTGSNAAPMSLVRPDGSTWFVDRDALGPHDPVSV